MRNFSLSGKNVNWFYISLVVFIIALPFGESLISISIGLIFLTSLFYIKRETFVERIKERKLLLFIFSIYIVYLIGCIFCNDMKWGLYDLRKCLAYFFIPLAFIFGGKMNRAQVKNLLLIFVFAVFVSSVITLSYFYTKDTSTVLSAQKAGFIHHIRFSLELNLAMIILAVFFLFESEPILKYSKVVYVFLFGYLLFFLLWHQSFTGLFTFLGTLFIGVFLLTRKIKSRIVKSLMYLILVLIIVIPSAYLYYTVKEFYTIDKIDYSNLEKFSPGGNAYFHDTNNKQVENGHYIWLYVCEKELKPAWNQRSAIKYNETGGNGYPVRETLIRYLASKNLRKDREGVNSLTDEDIKNIQAGISNYILAQNGFLLYPRIYVSLWELDTYFKTGYANHQSLSQRIEYSKAAFHIIKNNFWFGVGTGNWKKAYADAYRVNKSKMDPARYGDAHNQYLNYMVKFGLVGVLWILFAILYPVARTGKYKDPVFLLFLISMLISNFGDSNFETHVGGAFFVFMYCLFLSSDGVALKPASSFSRK